MKGFGRLILVVLAGIMPLIACTKGPEKVEAPDNRPLVVTTFFPLYDFARNIAGDRARVENLLPSGVGPHDFSFAPKDRMRLEGARLLIKNGFGLESFLSDFSPPPDRTLVVEAGEGVNPLESGDGHDHGERGHGEEGVDPHVWLDPANALVMVKNIKDALIAVDPAGKEVYEANADRYLAQLQELDNELRREISGFSQKKFVAFHSAFTYLARRYGLTQVAVFEEVPGREPSPRYVAGLMDTMKKHGITVIFTEPQFSPRIVTTVAKDMGARVMELDPMETGDFEKGSYIGVMRQNLSVLKEAMGRP